MTGEYSLHILDRDDIPVLDDNLTLFHRVVQIHHDPSKKGDSDLALFVLAKWFKTKEKSGSTCIVEVHRWGFIQIGFDQDVDYFDFLFNWRKIIAESLEDSTK